MSFGAVHQFHSGTALGDAITNQMLELQRRLRRLGHVSEIYSQYIGDGLEDRVKPLSAFQERPATLLLVHHSMGHTAFPAVTRLRVPIVTVFHSITPASFFDDPGMRHHIRLGFGQLHELASRSMFGVADSNHNRQQMYDAGFQTVEVMPVRTDFRDHHGIRNERTTRWHDWLFVGRVVPNKRQVDLVRAHAIHRRSGGAGTLQLVGDLSFAPYVDEVRREIDRLDAHDHVVLHGKVGHRQLLDRYRDAGVFVCLSEHEGFGVPLLEAMAAGLPVVARDEAAVAETMGGAGGLLTQGDPATAAALVRVVDGDDDLRARMVAHQDERLAKLESFDIDGFLTRVVDRAAGRLTGTTLQVQGPFETSYSLAILNRELALHMARYKDLDVSLYATEGPGDYTPDIDDLAAHPDAAKLYEHRGTAPFPEVAIRQMFPPRVADSTAGMTFQYFGWEESRLPQHIVDDFNRHLDGIGTMSRYVKEILVASGVDVPVCVVGVGVHQPDPAAVCDAEELVGLRAKRFLHISSAFPRKGVDVLLRGWFETFDDRDDVSLILKTFPNPHNEVAAQLAALRAEFPAGPHVCWIDRDLDRAQIDGLYRMASVYVHTARGEGFGLPVAEAMLAGVPVISVASTGLADFVNDHTAAVVGHRTVPAASHVSVPGSEWAEPVLDDLRRELAAAAVDDHAARRSERVEAARRLIAEDFTWTRVAGRWHDFVTEQRRRRTGMSVAAVTTFNSRCGIAEYSAHLYDPMDGWATLQVFADDRAEPLDPEREESVTRVWSNFRSGPIDGLLAALDASAADLVHVQHNFGFFTLPELARLIDHETPRRPIVVTLHRTAPLVTDDGVDRLDDIAESLARADALIVHQEADRRRLAEAGISDNVHLLRHGTETLAPIDIPGSRRRHGLPSRAFVVGTFGFLLPHKGTLALLRAVAELRERGIDAWLVATTALHPDPSSEAHFHEVQAEIDRLGIRSAVRLITEFLDPADARDRLAAADVIVMPYEHTNESASGALRSVLPLGRAMVTSALPIFDDVAAVVPSLPAPVDPTALADLLEALWHDDLRRAEIASAVRDLAEATSWERTARWTRELYVDLLSEREDAERTEVAS